MTDVIKFEKNKDFLSGDAAAGITITAIKDAKVAEALAQNDPFPSGDVELGNISISGEAGKAITFAGKNGTVAFKASADAHAGLGVYFDPDKLLDALALNDKISPGMKLGTAPNSFYMLLNWGYDLAASAKGSIALGANPLTINFGVEGNRAASYAVVRRFAKETGSLDAVKTTVNSWILPTHLNSLDHLEPGTWLIAEVDGSIAINLGAMYGYDYNWIQQAKLGGLSGDIGLRIQLGVSVALGFAASGKYALVIGRDSQDAGDQHVRLRLFKQREKGWSFALNASASVQAKNELLPDELDDFVSAVFGVHGAQIVKDLKVLDKWTDPKQDLSNLVAGFTVDYAMKFLGDVTGLDPVAKFTEARSQLLGFIDKWNDLDHSLATMLLKLAESKVDLERVRNLSKQIAGADENSIKDLLGNVLKDVNFFRTPEGKWLESVAAGGILKIINNSHEIDVLKQVASKTNDILDGSAIENVLDRLHKYIDDHLHLTQIENAINQADFDNLDKWLKARLSAFLGQTVDFSKLDEIRQAINTVRSKGQEFYKVGLKALTNKYKAEFIATYQKTTTNTALIDVIFDFAVAGVGSSLEEAVDGKFDGLLIEQRAGVQLNTATLSHEIKRHSHVELSLPFFKTEMDHINTSLAQVTATDDDGRVLVYELDAKDIATAKNRRNSTLAVGGYWPIKANNQVRVHSTDSLTYSYSLRQVKADMKRADLQYQLRPYTEQYFSTVFSAGNNGNNSGSFDAWLSDLDNVAEQVLHNGPDNFGDTLLSLQVGVSSQATASWVNAPEDEKSPRYLEMSRRIQAKLKQSVPLIYFQDPHKYEATATAAALLTYSAIPPSTEISLSNGQATLNAPGDVYWDYQSPQQVEVMLSHPQTINSLSAILQRVSDRLLATPGFQGLAAEYKPERLGVILGLVRNSAIAQANLHSLLFVESKAVNAARDAGRRLAKFIKAASDKPSDAVEALTEFGAKFTETFNSELSGLHGGFNSRPLGTLLFIEAALALNPGLSADDLKTNAVLELIVLTEDAKFQPTTYLDGEIPAKEETVIEQRIVNLP